MKTYDQLTLEEQARALSQERSTLAGKFHDYLLGNNRETVPVAFQPIITSFDALALTRVKTRNYLTGEQERDAVRID